MVTFPKDLEIAKKLPWAPYAGRNLSYYFTYMHLRDTYGTFYEQLLGVRFAALFVTAEGSKWQMYRSPKESERLEKHVYAASEDPAYVQRVLDHTQKTYDALENTCHQYLNLDFTAMSNGELAKRLDAFRDVYLNAVASISCSIIFASALSQRIGKDVPENDLLKMALPLKKTIPLEEELAFWQLVATLQIQDAFPIASLETLSPSTRALVQKHFDAYLWLEAYENDPIWRMQDFVSRLNDAANQDASAKRSHLERRHDEQDQEIEALRKKHGVDALPLNQFRQAMYYRILGESLVGLANHATQKLFAAIAKKLFLPLNQIKWFSDEELTSALRGHLDLDVLSGRLSQRQQIYLIALGEKNVHAFEGRRDVKSILDQFDVEEPELEPVTEIRGVSAYPGKVQGIARVVHDVSELEKVKQGDILVTLNTTPSFVLAMKRSAAIVTDEGGITCHAAIVSRELGIPCIIGTKAGTRLIRDGAKIEVDAASGLVRHLDD